MRCECCGRETTVLIEIGAISPKVSVTGRCCVDCCAFILTALEDALLASGGNRQNKFIENRQNWIIEKDQTTQFWLIS